MPVISFKVSDAEARLIRAKARAVNAASVSEFIRSAALGERQVKAKMVRRIHPVSGLPYNAAPGPVVTDDVIRAALADFP